MNHKTAILYGIAIWTVVFIVAMLAFPLRANERPLFESIVPVIITLVVTAASVRYFSSITKRHFFIGLCLGIIWLLASLVLDALMFSWGPMKMTLWDYIKDIGVTYLIILTLPTGIGYLLQQKYDKK
jgi:hypothetical protein